MIAKIALLFVILIIPFGNSVKEEKKAVNRHKEYIEYEWDRIIKAIKSTTDKAELEELVKRRDIIRMKGRDRFDHPVAYPYRFVLPEKMELNVTIPYDDEKHPEIGYIAYEIQRTKDDIEKHDKEGFYGSVGVSKKELEYLNNQLAQLICKGPEAKKEEEEEHAHQAHDQIHHTN